MKELRSIARFVCAFAAGATLPAALIAQTTGFQMGTVYQCAAEMSFKVMSCSGAGAADLCDVQAYVRGQLGQRGKSTRQQIMALLPQCHPQTAQEARVAGTGGSQMSSNGISVGDQVEVVTGFGWTPAKVLAINGNSYRVLANGVQVTKDYPREVRRLGPGTDRDRAAGQYRLGDRVQVNVDGRWVDAKVVTEMGMEYQVELAGNRSAWASPQNMRPAPAAAPAAPPKSGVPPKPGMASCAGKIEGRYATTGGFGTFTVIFRSGKATMTDITGNNEVFECWMSGEKIILHEPGKPELDMDIDINNDGTLQTPLGEIKKKGN